MTADDLRASETAEALTRILDTLDETVRTARSMPMSSSAIVNRGELLELIERAKAILPSQLVEADELLSGAADDRVRAQTEAQDIIDAARQRAQELIETDVITAEAQVKAQQILDEANRHSEALKQQTEQYCERRLADFEGDLTTLIEQVRIGRGRLASGLGN